MIDIYKFLKKYTSVDLIYQNINGQQFIFKTKIDQIYEDKVFLEHPTVEPIPFNNLELYTKFTVVFCTESGVLSGNVNLLQNSSADNHIIISFPYNIQFCQRRENTRVPMHIDVELSGGELSETIILKTKNISGRGLACFSEKPLADFHNAHAILHIPDGDIKVICRKVYSKEIDFGQDKIFLNGIEFTEISDTDINNILRVCLKFQIDSKHNERLFETL